MQEAERALTLWQILHDETDEAHPMSMSTIIARLTQKGIPSQRRSVYSAITALRNHGMDIRYEHRSYYLKHDFSPAEITILADSVQDSVSLSSRETTLLTKKLKNMLSLPQQKVLSLNPPSSSKSRNDAVLKAINLLLQASAHHYPVGFIYYDIQPDGSKKYRRSSRRYNEVPYAVISSGGRFYAVLYSPLHKGFANYRIDKMERITVKEEETEPVRFDKDAWLARSFDMYAGTPDTITLRLDPSMAQIVFDTFGTSVLISEITDSYFIANIRTAITPTLTAWLLEFYDRCTVLKPDTLIQQMRTIAMTIENAYNKGGGRS